MERRRVFKVGDYLQTAKDTNKSVQAKAKARLGHKNKNAAAAAKFRKTSTTAIATGSH